MKIKPLTQIYCNHNKKGESMWISWVMITAFAVALSAFMYSFMVEYTETSTDNIKKTVFNTDECRTVSISIETVCQNVSTQDLNIEVQNRNYRRIDSLDYRLYDSNKKPLTTNSTTISLNPNRKKAINLSGATAVQLGMVEVIPIVEREEFTIICAEKKASSSTIASNC